MTTTATQTLTDADKIAAVAQLYKAVLAKDAKEKSRILRDGDYAYSAELTDAERIEQDAFDVLTFEQRQTAVRAMNLTNIYSFLTTSYSDAESNKDYTFARRREIVEALRIQNIAKQMYELSRQAKQEMWTDYLSSLKAGDKLRVTGKYSNKSEGEFVKHNPEKSFQYAIMETHGRWGRAHSTPQRVVVMVKWSDFVNSWSADIEVSPEFSATMKPRFRALVKAAKIAPQDWAKARMAHRGVFERIDTNLSK